MQWVRDNRRVAQIILFAICITFAFSGVAALRNFQSDPDVEAKVGRLTISRSEVDREMANQLNRLRQMVGGKLDPAIFNTPEARRNVLDQLIAQRAMEQESERLRIAIGDEQLRSMIGRQPVFQLNNVFYKQYYDDFAASRGQTAAQLDKALRNDFSVSQFATMPGTTSVASTSAIAAVSALYGQERSVAAATIDPAAYVGQVKVADADITAYYDSHKSSFETPQKLDVQYVVLSSGRIGETTKVSDDDLKAYYEQNKQRFTTPEQRRASHILIAVDASATPEQKAAARAKAEKVLAEVKADPKNFAKYVTQYSDDPGSKERGGDLDFTPRGGWVKPFEDAAFAMKKGEISNLVQSDFGFHIIELTDIHPGEAKSLADVRPQLESEVRAQVGNRSLAEQVDAFTNMVYEQPDSLQPAIDRFGLKSETVKGVTRNGAPPSALASPKLMEALFSDDVLRNHRNTPAIETAPGNLVSARVAEIHPAETRPLDEVRGQIVQIVTREQATKLAREAGEHMLAELREGKPASAAAFDAPAKVTLQNTSAIAPQNVRDVFRTTAKQTLPAYVGSEIGDRGYQIVRVDSVSAADANAAAAVIANTSEQIKRTLADAETNAFVAAVKARTKISINEKDAP